MLIPLHPVQGREEGASRPCQHGFSVIELLVGLGLTLALTTAAASMVLSSRRLYTTDQNRTSLNQNLRSGMDLMGVDLRQAAERIPDDMPAIFVTDGGAGPDTLVLRRNLLEHVLPLCENLPAGTPAAQVYVAKNTGTIPQGCDPLPDTDADGWPDNIGAWRNYRLGLGGVVEAYIYSPVSGTGEFFPFDDEDSAGLFLHRSDSNNWLNSYYINELPRIYIMDQRTYQVAAGVLQYYTNDDTANPVNLIADMTGFQVRAYFAGVPQDSMGPTDDWTQLESIEVTLQGTRGYMGRTMSRSLSSRFFPRNILSH